MSSLPTTSPLQGGPQARRPSLSIASPARAPHPITQLSRLTRLQPPSPIASLSSMSPSPAASPDSSHLPFNFGAEFELIIRPKDISALCPDLSLPEFDASHRHKRDFNRALLLVISTVLSDSGLPCKVFTVDEDEEAKPDYSQWHITMDASLTKKHIGDGFYPVEIVTPVIKADVTWTKTIDQFWSIIHKHFDLRRDTSCGMHIHISPAQGRFDLDQLRCIAKGVVDWERDTARCAPPSRDDKIQSFCLSNVAGVVPAARPLQTRGPLRDYVCPDKHRAWNFLPARESGHGSVEFRRPPGVVTSKKAKHWIAFTMSFINMALRTNLDRLVRRLIKLHVQRRNPDTVGISVDFEAMLLASAETLGIRATLDPRLRQLDEPRSLHITMMRPDQISRLRDFDKDYHLSANA